MGWYTTGDSFKAHDVQINEIFRKYTDRPIFLVVDVEHSVRNGVFRMNLDFQLRLSLLKRRLIRRLDRFINHSSISSLRLLLQSLKKLELNIFWEKLRRFLWILWRAVLFKRCKPWEVLAVRSKKSYII